MLNGTQVLNSEDLRVGMRVMFGRLDAERNSGVIVKLMTARARVVSLEPRLGHPAGTLRNQRLITLRATTPASGK